MKSREIIIKDDESAWFSCMQCDATDCSNCPVRFICLTTKNESIIVTCPVGKVNDKIRELNNYRWRLRDGSSRARANRHNGV